jgi:hypothetical protein
MNEEKHSMNYTQNIANAVAFLGTQILGDGAILYTSTQIDPYFSNIAAQGLLKDTANLQARIAQAEAWMNWYIAHFNWPDYNGIYGSVYNYNVSGGVETSTGGYDSADAYAGTFLSLAQALWLTGDAGAQSFIQNTVGHYNLDVVGNVITNMQQANGLAWAKPDYQIEFLMDNCENYRGISDLASLFQSAFGDSSGSQWYGTHAAQIKAGIQSALLIPSSNLYYTSVGAAAPNLTKWYPDMVAQLYPIVHGVILPSSATAKHIYSELNANWPGWDTLSYNNPPAGHTGDPFPWCVVGYAAYLMGDHNRVNTFLTSINTKYGTTFPWPFYSAEAGWYIKLNAAMGGI